MRNVRDSGSRRSNLSWRVESKWRWQFYKGSVRRTLKETPVSEGYFVKNKSQEPFKRIKVRQDRVRIYSQKMNWKNLPEFPHWKDYETFQLYRRRNHFWIRLALIQAYQLRSMKPNRNGIVMLRWYHFFEFSTISIQIKLAVWLDPTEIASGVWQAAMKIL